MQCTRLLLLLLLLFAGAPFYCTIVHRHGNNNGRNQVRSTAADIIFLHNMLPTRERETHTLRLVPSNDQCMTPISEMWD
jgi:hypothetical protein